MKDTSIQSLRKGIDLLFLFSEAEPRLPLTQISARLKLPKSTGYRFVATLKAAGLLVQDAETKLYRLGARLLSLQFAIVTPVDLRTLALPLLRRLVDESGETAHLTEWRGPVGVIAEVVESPQLLRMAPMRGQAFALHAGALCRAILAFLPPREIEQILRQHRLTSFTPNTPVSRRVIDQLLRETRERGYAISVQEVTRGACGISAPVVGRDGWAVASIGVSGPVERLVESKRGRLAATVRAAGTELSHLVKQHLTSSLPTTSSAQAAARG